MKNRTKLMENFDLNANGRAMENEVEMKHGAVHMENVNLNSKGVEQCVPIEKGRVQYAKSAYNTRRINKDEIASLLTGDISPQAGDLVLAEVVRLGQHKRIELAHGRRATLFPGDEIIVCYGNRYAPDQFEAEIPNDLSECHLVAAGGVASSSLSRNSKIKAATTIRPLGLLADASGKRINMSDWALPALSPFRNHVPVITVVGTSMNAGKTTTAAGLIKGFGRAGLKVGAAKVTGTGAGGDVWLMKDSGTAAVYDFTDAGYVSTHRTSIAELEGIASKLLAQLAGDDVDVIILEVADGLLQEETSGLLRSEKFRAMIDSVIFAAGDAMGAHHGVEWLRQNDLPVIAVSGALTASPLACREAEKIIDFPVLGLAELSSAEIVSLISTSQQDQSVSIQAAS